MNVWGDTMSYGIIRIQKIKTNAISGIQIHDKRVKNISHSNKDIDFSKSKLNYRLDNKVNETYHETIKNRIGELNLKKAVRKDAIKMGQALVTSDTDFFNSISKEQQEQFFKDSYYFLKDRYGEKNIISATVHLDEKTPHLHFNFVPVTEDNRLSAKNVFKRSEYKTLHDDFYDCIGSKYGLLRGEKKETPQKHLPVQEFKKETLKQLNKDIELLENKKNVIDNSINKVLNEYNRLSDTVKKTKSSYIYTNNLDYQISKLNKEKVILNKKDFEILKQNVNNLYLISEENTKLENELIKFKNYTDKFYSEYKKLKDEQVENTSTINELSKELEISKKQLKNVMKCLDHMKITDDVIKVHENKEYLQKNNDRER